MPPWQSAQGRPLLMPVVCAQSRPNWFFPAQMPPQDRGHRFLLRPVPPSSHVLFDVGRHLAAVQQTRVQQHLAGVVAAQFGNDRRGDLVPIELCDMRRAGRDIRKAQACFFPLRTGWQCSCLRSSCSILLSMTVPGVTTADDIALDQPFCLCRVFHLLADGDLCSPSK